MKKKIIIGLSIFSFFFLVGGIYIITTIETVTSRLDNLIKLHQVEILREHLLIRLKRVQTDLYLRNTRHARNVDTVVVNVRNMENLIKTCFKCHHDENNLERLNSLSLEIEKYKNSLSRVMTVRANIIRLETEEENAFQIGERLIARVNNMISATNLRLDEKTSFALKEIAQTKIMLYILVSLAPLATLLLAYILIKGITTPIHHLRDAALRLKSGDLDYKIKGLKDEFGEVASSFNDMSTALQEHMRVIHDSEARYRMLFESAGQGIFILEAEGDKKGDIVAANQAAADMHGYTLEEIKEMNIKDLDSPEDAQKVPERIGKIMQGELINEEIMHRKKDGTLFPVELSAGLLKLVGHTYIIAFDRDISERKKAEQALRESENKLKVIFDNAIDGILLTNVENKQLFTGNKQICQMLGYKPEEIKNLYIKDIHPEESLPDVLLEFDLQVKGEKVLAQNILMKRKDGTTFYADIAASSITLESKTYLMGIIRDITERKKTDEVLLRAEQMKLVGEWATGLAHEIKNPLAGIKVSVEVLAAEQNLSENDRTIALKVIDEIKRIEVLIKSLLSFAKPPVLQLMTVDVNEILDRTISIYIKHPSLSSNITPKITFVKEYEELTPEILADPLQLQQAFLNLFINAIDSMPDGGTLSIKTSYHEEQQSLKIMISDTGKGIDDKLSDKIFQPFFTTKTKGTGLGLAITKRLIEQHGGNISYLNNPDKGASFYIDIPVVKHMHEAKTT